MRQTPAIAIAINQSIVIGPKKAATRAVPCDCTANSANRIPRSKAPHMAERRGGDLQSLDRREDGQRGRDDGVAIE